MPPMPRLPTIWAARVVAYLRSPATPELRSPKKSCSATIPPSEIWTSELQLRLGLGVALLGIGMGQQSEGGAALDDRQHLQLAGLADQPGHGGVAGLVGGDGAPLGLGVLDRLGQADLLGHLGLLHVLPGHLGGAPPQGPHQGLVEQVDQHGRAVAEGLGGQLVGALGHLRLVGPTGQLVIEDLLAPGPARQVEGDGPVEAARAEAGPGPGRRPGWSPRSPARWPRARAACGAAGRPAATG